MLPTILEAEFGDSHKIGNGSLVFGELECQGSFHHSPTPLMVRRFSLCPWGEQDLRSIADSYVWLCGVCADNLRVFQVLLERYNGEVPWKLQRQFGNALRVLGFQGWKRHLENIERSDPFRADPFETDPFGTDPFGTDPFGTDPFGTDPFGSCKEMHPAQARNGAGA